MTNGRLTLSHLRGESRRERVKREIRLGSQQRQSMIDGGIIRGVSQDQGSLHRQVDPIEKKSIPRQI